MSDVWRIFVVEGDEALNQNIVNMLHKDGYDVRGTLNGADAVRVLWSDEYDVVICDLRTPGADGFELLQWLRAYRPNTRMIMVGTSDAPALRVQALESGAVSYLEKPLDLRLLKDELRRLQQQSGFTASLDSFDLLDVIQIISHKSITLLVNIGLEERGVLRFQNGELIWAEYGLLRGEEAFFALAAHKNGTVTEQFWNEPVTANVTQPLSRLIFQALQYRSKYADKQQYTGEIDRLNQQLAQHPSQAVNSSPQLSFSPDDIDDSPFVFAEGQPVSDSAVFSAPGPVEEQLQPTARFEPIARPSEQNGNGAVHGSGEREWWERTDQMGRIQQNGNVSASSFNLPTFSEGVGAPEPAQKEVPPPQVELPSWLMDQPTASGISSVRVPTPQPEAIPATPRIGSSSKEWDLSQSSFSMTEDLAPSDQTQAMRLPSSPSHMSSSSTWQPMVPPHTASYPAMPSQQPSGALQPATNGRPGQEAHPTEKSSDALQDSNPMLATGTLRAQRLAARRNYAALVSALQTLGYSITGFIAAAVINIEGQPVAQVAIDDLDISKLCRYFSVIQKSILQALAQEAEAGDYEETVITSFGRHILMRAVGTDRKAFLVLITTREANPPESLEVMANVEGAISAALR